MDDSRTENLKVQEAAALLGVHEKTVRRMIKAGELPASKVSSLTGFVYVIKRADCEALLGQKVRKAPAAVQATEVALGRLDTALSQWTRKMDTAQAAFLTDLQDSVQALQQDRDAAARIAQERDAAIRRGDGLQAENDRLREALARLEAELEAERRRTWWQRLTGGGEQ